MIYHSENGHTQYVYNSLDEFTDIVLREGNEQLEDILLNISRFEEMRNLFIRPKNEILLDLLIIFSLWEEYKNKRWNTARWIAPISKSLFHLGNINAIVKPLTEKIRGGLNGLVLEAHQTKPQEFTMRNYWHFVRWIHSTCEFNEETHRLKALGSYFENLNAVELHRLFLRMNHFIGWFYRGGRFYLGDYTMNVSEFVSKNRNSYRFHSHYFYLTQSELLYFLNLVGAEILNRMNMTAFRQTTRLKMLLPPPFQTFPNQQWILHDIQNAWQINNSKDPLNPDFELIPMQMEFGVRHSLKTLSNSGETGIVVVSSILDLLKNALEVKRLRLPGQCIFLHFELAGQQPVHVNLPVPLLTQRLVEIISGCQCLPTKNLSVNSCSC